MRCFECRYLDRSKVLTCYPPKYYCTYDNTTHFADDECKYEHYPIVRCKDCEYYDVGENELRSWEWCVIHQHCVDDNYFCSWAKMKGDNE